MYKKEVKYAEYFMQKQERLGFFIQQETSPKPSYLLDVFDGGPPGSINLLCWCEAIINNTSVDHHKTQTLNLHKPIDVILESAS